MSVFPIHNLLYPDSPVLFGPHINLPMTLADHVARSKADSVGVFSNPFHGRLEDTVVEGNSDSLVIIMGTVHVVYVVEWRTREEVYFHMSKVIHGHKPPVRVML